MSFIFVALENNFLDDVEVSKVRDFELALLHYIKESAADLLEQIQQKPALSDGIKEKMRATLEAFKQTQAW